MMFKKNFYILIILTVIALLFVASCDRKHEPLAPEFAPLALNSIITLGPADGAGLVYLSSPTFKWKGEVSPGTVTGFKWTFVDAAGDTTESEWDMEMAQSFQNLVEGDYSFAVIAMADSGLDEIVETTAAARHFSVLASDVVVPIVTLVDQPTDDSKKPPGANVFLSWTASDESIYGEVVGYSFRLAGDGLSATDWSDWNLDVTSAAYADMSLGSYTFEVKARDNSGLESAVTTCSFDVIPPTILIVDDDSDMPDLATDAWMHEILRDYSWADWDVAERGIPTAADLSGYSTVAWYVDASTRSFYYFGLPESSPDYVANPLKNFLDGGGNLWLMGGEILYYLGAALEDTTVTIFSPGQFARDYLHVTDGGDAGGDEFGLLAPTSLPVAGYTKIGVPGNATGTGWPDELVPDASAEAVFLLGPETTYDPMPVTGIRYIGTDFKVVYFGVNFSFIATNGNHLTISPEDTYPVANHIMGVEFGE